MNKFRVWDTKNRKYLDPKDYFIRGDGRLFKSNIPKPVPGESILAHFECLFDIRDRFVVEQFTGLLDKSGVEIYEGDKILTQEYKTKLHSTNNVKKKRFTGMVQFNVGLGEFGITTKKKRYYSAHWLVKLDSELGDFRFGSWGDFYDCEVIGSIHDKIKGEK